MIPLQTAKADLPGSEDFVDALVRLHNRTVDALAGYAKMVEKADASFKPVAEEFRALHATHAEQLVRLIAGYGREVDEDGTLMGSVNVAVVSLRALLDRIDSDVMDNIRSGEENVLTAFDEAIAAADDPALTTDLMHMRDELTALLDRTSSLG